MSAPEPSLEQCLGELQRQSEQRRQELREIAAQLPAVMSRRAILRSMAAELVSAAKSGEIAGQAWHKAAALPREAYRAIRYRLRPDGP